MNNKNTIAFIAFGETNARQAIFSISSLWLSSKAKSAGFSVVVYSDQPERFEFLGNFLQIGIHALLKDYVHKAIQPENYFPKLKIMLMDEMLSDNAVQNLILLDSDTIFLKDPTTLFERLDKDQLVLHLREWKFGEGRKANPILCPTDGDLTLESGTRVDWNDESEMYNVGVIGVSSKNKRLIRDSLDFIVKYHALYPSWHVEQLCVSLIFQQHSKIRFAKRQVYHYWHNKPLFEKATKGFFSLIAEGKYEEALTEAEKIITRMIFQMRVRFFFSRAKVLFRDLPGVYKTYKFCFKLVEAACGKRVKK